MTLLSNTEETRSSVYITQKRYIEHNEVEGTDKTELSQFSTDEPVLKKSKLSKSNKTYPILIRLTDGNSDKSKKQKISTVVQPDALSKFWKEYSSVIKSGVVGLKKTKKSKKKKAAK
ncbi:Signal recognition particle subunit SRP14 [Cyberlindnera fabianii]|uniref:Signal recognition particle subunit SRP14 n=1 Tax=Cyberlindnera fabianii TaxID=36022 RepID=A0A1V2L8C0_CYBFA|nr:Signal recognition particle subunit SRP14 [Cyberlindnera fabianii]